MVIRSLLLLLVACSDARPTVTTPPPLVECAPAGSDCRCDKTSACDPGCAACDPECTCAKVMSSDASLSADGAEVPDADSADVTLMADAAVPDASMPGDSGRHEDAASVFADASPQGNPTTCTAMCGRIYSTCGFRFGNLDSAGCFTACVRGDFGGAEDCLARVAPRRLICSGDLVCLLGDLNVCQGVTNPCIADCDARLNICDRGNSVCLQDGICASDCGVSFPCRQELSACYQRC